MDRVNVVQGFANVVQRFSSIKRVNVVQGFHIPVTSHWSRSAPIVASGRRAKTARSMLYLVERLRPPPPLMTRNRPLSTKWSSGPFGRLDAQASLRSNCLDRGKMLVPSSCAKSASLSATSLWSARIGGRRPLSSSDTLIRSRPPHPHHAEGAGGQCRSKRIFAITLDQEPFSAKFLENGSHCIGG